MPQDQIPVEDQHDSGSSLSISPPLRNNPRLLYYQPNSVSSQSSLGSDPDLEVIVEQGFPAEPHYLPIILPVEPTFEELLTRVVGHNDLQNEESLKIRVISYMISLQRLPLFMPKLKSLNLDGSVLSSLRDLGCGLTRIKYLNVSNCGLRSLDGTNGIPTLEVLIADGNMIESVGQCCNLTDLKKLSLRQNKIKDVGLVTFLAMCPLLVELNLEDNPVINQPGYEESVKRNIQSLEILDGHGLSAADINNHSSLTSSSTSMENPSSLSEDISSEQNTENDLINIETNLPEDQQPASSKENRPLSADPIHGSVIGEVRRQKSELSCGVWFSSSSNSISSNNTDCDKVFPDRLSQCNVDLELGIVGEPKDEVQTKSESIPSSLQDIARKWRAECQRKKNESV